MAEVITGPLRMRGDRILLKPLAWEGDTVHGQGTQLAVVRQGRPVRGEVIAIGPGIHPVSKRANTGDGRRRIEFSTRSQPTEVKVGDIIQLWIAHISDGRGYEFPEVIVDDIK